MNARRLIPPPQGEGGERSEPGGVAQPNEIPTRLLASLAATLPEDGEGFHAYKKSSTAVSAITAGAVLCRPARACSSWVRVACR